MEKDGRPEGFEPPTNGLSQTNWLVSHPARPERPWLTSQAG